VCGAVIELVLLAAIVHDFATGASQKVPCLAAEAAAGSKRRGIW